VDLRKQLGEEVFEWLCACAVYPELHWDLTVRLGALPGMSSPLLKEIDVLRLVSLRWFRNGSLPEAIRRELIAELSGPRKAAVRNAIIDVLRQNPAPRGSFAEQSQQLYLAVQHFWKDPRDRLARKRLKEAVSHVSVEDLQSDYALLESSEALSADALAFLLPLTFRRIFYPKGVLAIGIRTPVRALFTVLLTAALLAGLQYLDRRILSSEAVPLQASVSPTTSPMPPPQLAPEKPQPAANSPASKAKLASPPATPDAQIAAAPNGAPAPIVSPAPNVEPASEPLAGQAQSVVPQPKVEEAAKTTDVPKPAPSPAPVTNTAIVEAVIKDPLGILLTGRGELRRAGLEASIMASPGELLYAGDVLAAATGPLVMADCQSRIKVAMQPQDQVMITASGLKVVAGKPVQSQVVLCELPSNTIPPPTAGRPSPHVPDAKNPLDILSNAVLYERAGNVQQASSAYLQLATFWPNAIWLRDRTGVWARGLVPTPTVPRGKTYALVIGISRYQSSSSISLKYADADANAFAQFLATPRGGGAETYILTNQMATAAAIRNNLQRITRQASPSDSIVLAIAAMGVAQPKESYLMGYDSEPEDLESTGISLSELRSVLEQARTASTIAYLDLCHAGAIGVLQRNDFRKLGAAIGTINTGRTPEFIFAATSQSGVAFEGANFGGGHGAFTYFVLRGLNGDADLNHDGQVTRDELVSYVRNQVAQSTVKRQIPVDYGNLPEDTILSETAKVGIQLSSFTPLSPAGAR